MKREAPDTPSVLSSAPTSPSSSVASPTPAPATKRAKATKATTKKPKPTATKQKAADTNGDFTSKKKAAVVERLFAAGYKATNLAELAKELLNALQAGRKGNLRDKAVAAAAAAASASKEG
ncbi:hypothetical protein Q8F55_007895 [Vanrija albida]|uniref:Uncharacterized protein n=1 Tax=Vanrija albida TaxID=181172 RepID=A0ABR3PUZ6_9TREE